MATIDETRDHFKTRPEDGPEPFKIALLGWRCVVCSGFNSGEPSHPLFMLCKRCTEVLEKGKRYLTFCPCGQIAFSDRAHHKGGKGICGVCCSRREAGAIGVDEFSASGLVPYTARVPGPLEFVPLKGDGLLRWLDIHKAMGVKEMLGAVGAAKHIVWPSVHNAELVEHHEAGSHLCASFRTAFKLPEGVELANTGVLSDGTVVLKTRVKDLSLFEALVDKKVLGISVESVLPPKKD